MFSKSNKCKQRLNHSRVIRRPRRPISNSVVYPPVRHQPLKFVDQVINLPSHLQLKQWADTFTTTQTAHLVDSTATILPPLQHSIPSVPYNHQSSFSDYINFFSSSFATSPEAIRFEEQSNQSSHLNVPNNNDQHQFATNNDVKTHFRHFWNFLQPQLDPYTLLFTHKGKFTFNYPPNTTKLTVKIVPFQLSNQSPSIVFDYPTRLNHNIKVPLFIIPQITIAEYFSPSQSIISPIDNILSTLPSTQQPNLKPIHKFIQQEKNNFIPIHNLISQDQFNANIQQLLFLTQSSLPAHRSPKHAYTHEHELILFPTSENRHGLNPNDISSVSSTSTTLSLLNNHNETTLTNHHKILPSTQYPDSYPGFPFLPIIVHADNHVDQTLHSILNRQQSIPDLIQSSIPVTEQIQHIFHDSNGNKLPHLPEKDLVQENLHPWHNPTTSIHTQHLDLQQSIPETAPETLVRRSIQQSSNLKRFTYDTFRTEILPQLLTNQHYSHFNTDFDNQDHLLKQIINTPLETPQQISILREDLDMFHLAQYPSKYQTIHNPLSPDYIPTQSRPNSTLVPSDLLLTEIIKMLESNSVQEQFIPSQLRDFIGPIQSNDISNYYDQLRNKHPKHSTLYRYGLPFYTFNINHPYQPNQSGCIFQQLRQFTYQHYNPIMAHFPHTSDQFHLNVYLFSNTTVNHDPYLQSGWYNNIAKKIRYSEQIMNKYAHEQISTFNLVSTLFTPTSVKIQQQIQTLLSQQQTHITSTNNNNNITNTTTNNTNTHIKQLQQKMLKTLDQDDFVGISDFVRHPGHDAIIHGALVNPVSQELVTSFSATFSRPYDPHFFGYNGLTSQYLIYEIIRASFGYKEPQKELVSDIINNIYPHLPLPYHEVFIEPTPLKM